MFRFLGKLIKKAPHECLQHNTQKFPNILANEYCQSCEQSMCYMCGIEHIKQCHPVRVSPISTPKMKLYDHETLTENEIKYQQILQAFNTGSLIQMDINKLKCICGKQADEHTSICAACGSATCSQECHQELVHQEKCKFHHNFTAEAKNVSLRSILIKNAYFLYDKGYAQGSVFSRTSQHFISAFLSSQRSLIYLQRGYRQYGNPEILTLDAMDIVQNAELDKEIHLMRACTCSCSQCRGLGHHAVHLCQPICKQKELYVKFYLCKIYRSYVQDHPEEKHNTCQCQCQFCKSGHTVFSHKKIDCCLKCDFRPKPDF